MIDRKAFAKDENNWELKKTGKFFLGREISISVDTRIDSEDPVMPIFDEQMETLNLILPKMEELSKIIEEGILKNGYVSREELIRVADNPHIWLGMDTNTMRPWKNNQWFFVVGVTESEDFAWDTEFEGLQYCETSAGD